MANNEKVLSMGSSSDVRDIGIDLGTANIVICQKGRGVILREPSLAAVDLRTNEIVAAGKEAKEMLGKTPENISVVSPMASGAVAQVSVCAAMLKYFINKTRMGIKKPRTVIGVPAGITDVERKAVEDAARQAGLVSVYLVELPMASAVGAGIPVGQAKGSLVINLGMGITEAAVVALGDTVASSTMRFGSQDIDRDIKYYIRRKYGLIIGDNTAEEIKIKIGSVYRTDDTYDQFMEVRGRSAAEGIPKSYTVGADEIREVIVGSVGRICELLTRCLEITPPELVADIMTKGIILTGGGAQLRGLDKYMTEVTGINTVVTERPLECSADGIGRILDVVINSREKRRNSVKR